MLESLSFFESLCWSLLRLVTLLKSDSNTGVFLEYCEIFKEYLCHRTPPCKIQSAYNMNKELQKAFIKSTNLRNNFLQSRNPRKGYAH